MVLTRSNAHPYQDGLCLYTRPLGLEPHPRRCYPIASFHTKPTPASSSFPFPFDSQIPSGLAGPIRDVNLPPRPDVCLRSQLKRLNIIDTLSWSPGRDLRIVCPSESFDPRAVRQAFKDVLTKVHRNQNGPFVHNNHLFWTRYLDRVLRC